MRTVLAVLMVVAACGGDDGNTPVDAAVDGKTIAPPDADLDIAGSWVDKYITMTGTSTVASCTVAPTAVVIDPMSGGLANYPGTCKGDGTFRITMAPHLGTYYLRMGSSWFETNKRTGIDMSLDHLGRADAGAVAGASLALNLSNLDAWTAGDLVFAFAPNIGYFQNLNVSPATNATTVQATVPWAGYKVDAAKGDALQLVQLSIHQTPGGLTYTSLDRVFDVPSFTMANNATSTINGAFATTAAKTQQVQINVASFNAFASAVNPNVNARTVEGSMYAAPSTDTIRSPALLSFSLNAAGVSALNFGSLSYGDPFPSSWQRLVRIQEAFTVPYSWNNVPGAMNAITNRIMPASYVEANIVNAVLGPPTTPKIDGDDAFKTVDTSQVPRLSWSPPSVGTPTDYEIQAYEVTVNGAALKFTSVLKLTTKQTSIRIPSGALLGQRQYVFAIRARIRENVDIYNQPLRAGESSSTAELLTALVTTDT